MTALHIQTLAWPVRPGQNVDPTGCRGPERGRNMYYLRHAEIPTYTPFPEKTALFRPPALSQQTGKNGLPRLKTRGNNDPQTMTPAMGDTLIERHTHGREEG